MAKVGEEHVFNFMSIKTFYRLPVSYGKDHFWINVGKNSIVKVHDHKLVHTWTLTHPHSFTSPVIFIDDDDTLCCTLDNKTLIRWCVDSDSLKGAIKLKFKENIFTAIAIEGKKPLLIFNSGKFLIIESQVSNLEPCGRKVLDSNEELLWADATMFKSEVVIFLLTFDGKNKIHKLHSFAVTIDNESVNYFSQKILHESATLKSWCLNKFDLAFLSMWSNGDIIQYNESQVQNRLLCISNIENNHVLLIDVIDSSHIALFKCQPTQKESALEIWDSKFSALKVKKNVKISFSEHMQLSILQKNIFLQSNEDLVSVSFHVDRSTLAAAVGKSTIASSETAEFSWDKSGKLIDLSSDPGSPNCQKNDSNAIEISDSIEAIARKLVKDCPTYLKYIPESELVKLLLLAIRCKEKEGIQKHNSDADIILSMVFSASFSDVFLLKYLKKLNVEETLIVLELLLGFLNGTQHSPSNECERPSDLQIFNWTCLIIQSHMEALLFSKDKKTFELLRNLEESVSDKMEEYEDFEGIQNYFYILKKKNILPEKCVTGDYCIETLDL